MADEVPIPPEPEALGFKQSEYEIWRHNPMTQFIMQTFMGHSIAVLEREHLARWKEGGVDAEQESETRARILVMEELKDLPFNYLVEFYAGFEEHGAKAPGEIDGAAGSTAQDEAS